MPLPLPGGPVADPRTDQNFRSIQSKFPVQFPNVANVYGPVINVQSYKAKGDGTTDDTEAFERAAAALPAEGGTIVVPGGTYALSGTLDFNGSRSVRLLGVGGLAAGGSLASALKFTQAGSEPGISARTSVGFGLSDLGIFHSSGSYTGSLLDLSHNGEGGLDSAYGNIERCEFAGLGVRSAIGINLDKAIIMNIRGCYFQNLDVAGRGMKEGGGYSNSILFDGCTFTGMKTSPLKNAGDAWNVRACTFDTPLSGGSAAAYSCDEGVVSRATAFEGCWMGDLSTEAVNSTWINWRGKGLTVTSNLIGGSLGAATIFGVNVKAESGSVVITGNRFVTVTRPITLAEGVKRYIIGANEVSSASGKKVSLDGGATDAGEGFLSN